MTNRLIRQVYANRKRFSDDSLLKLQGIINAEVERRSANDVNSARLRGGE